MPLCPITCWIPRFIWSVWMTSLPQRSYVRNRSGSPSKGDRRAPSRRCGKALAPRDKWISGRPDCFSVPLSHVTLLQIVLQHISKWVVQEDVAQLPTYEQIIALQKKTLHLWTHQRAWCRLGAPCSIRQIPWSESYLRRSKVDIVASSWSITDQGCCLLFS
jgi:hypothetical protein